MKRIKAVATVSATLLAGCMLAGCTKAAQANARGKAGRAHITFMLQDYAGSPLSGEKAQEVFDTLCEYTNTDVAFNFVAVDSYEEKLGLTLANPANMPMVMHVTSLSSGIVDAAENGAFWDLNEFIWDSKKYPNLSQASKEISKALTVNKALIGIYKARDLGRYGLGYRTDWAEKLGLSKPKTIDDVYTMLKAFRNDDPDGNGKRDTYGLSMCRYTGPLDIIQTWFGAGNGWVEQDGALVPSHRTKAYKEALDWLKKLYDEELIAPDWAVRDSTTWADQVKKGESGVYIDVLDGSRRIWDYFVTNEIPSVARAGELAGMTLVGTINGKTLATPGYNGFFVVTKAAKTRAQVDACLHFIDKMCDDKMILLANYGIEGFSYEIDADGYIVDTKTEPSVVKNYGALNQALCFIPRSLTHIKPSVRQSERKQKEIDVIAENAKHAVINPAIAYLSNSPAYALNGAILDQILSDARTQYICGRIDQEGLQAAFDKWEKLGADVVREVNAQYTANR